MPLSPHPMPALLALLLAVLLTPTGSCLPPAAKEQQGIAGKVVVRVGNHMPGPGKRHIPGAQPASREIQVYTLTHLSQVQANGSFYTRIQTKQVAKVVSRPDGTFELSLNPGFYSLFSKEPAGLFANRFDGEGHIFPVEVKAGQVTPVEFVIDYNASY